MIEHRPRRRKTLFATIAVVAGIVLVGLELVRPPEGTSTGERWFWLVVGVGLVGLGLAELTGSGGRDGDAG